jgi:predicted phosphoserine aminotransferase
MIGHRSQAVVFPASSPACGRSQTGLVYITASSGSGLQEAAVRNTVARRLLVCIGGAFAERWYEIALANGLVADRLDVAWGEPHTPEQVAEALQRGYDALALVHNETSTGVENPLPAIAKAARTAAPDTLLLVDAVSSAGGVDLRTTSGIDVLLTSSQKCFALPPGLAFAAVSDRALERAAAVPHRGWYFDFLLLEKYLLQNNTPATPAISLLYALDAQLDRILAEGLTARFERHARMAGLAQAWAEARFALFPRAGFRSKTVTTVTNTRSIDILALSAHLARAGMAIANGYGPLKGKTVRIGHMGEIRRRRLDALAEIDTFSTGRLSADLAGRTRSRRPWPHSSNDARDQRH